MKPGKLSWSIRSSLDAQKMFIESGSAGESCPAHPSSFSYDNQSFKQNNWWFNKAGDNQEEKFEEGGVVIRCSVHNADHAQWLVEQGREGMMEKMKVGALLCEEDNEGSCLLSFSDSDAQVEAAVWNAEATSKIAHLMSENFIQWLISQANEGNWSKKDVVSIVCRKNADNQLILVTLDKNTKKQAAVFDKAKIVSAVPYMDTDFLQWLYQEAVEGRWEQSMVFEAVVKEELDGKAYFSTRIKPGINEKRFLSSECNNFMTNLFPQPLSSRALDLLEIVMVTEWEGLSF